MANVQPVIALQDCVYFLFSPTGCQRSDCVYGHSKPTYSALEQEVHRLGSIILDQHKQLTDMAERNIALGKRNKALLQKNDDLRDERAYLQQLFANMQIEIDALKHKNAVLTNQMDTLAQTIATLDDEVRTLRQKNNLLTAQNDTLRRKNGIIQHQSNVALVQGNDAISQNKPLKQKKGVQKLTFLSQKKMNPSKTSVQGKTGDAPSKVVVSTAKVKK